MKVAVVDVGSNSTRLLVAAVQDGRIAGELERATKVTRLAQGVDAGGRLAPEAVERTLAAVAAHRARIDALGADAAVAVLTSAVRDAADGPVFAAILRGRFGLDARILRGEQEAALTFRGATSERPPDGTELVVLDVGGGSTELVTGRDGVLAEHTSTQAGVVRQSERHLQDDPPAPAQLAALRAEAAQLFAAALPAHVRARVQVAVAVAGTATTSAAILDGVDPYDPARIQGRVLHVTELEALLGRLAALDLAARRAVRGLHPDRAPVIVAGLALLLEALGAFGLDRAEVSEHDILRGTALAVGAGDWTGV